MRILLLFLVSVHLSSGETYGLEDISSVSVDIVQVKDESLARDLKTKIELELRKSGIKVSDDSPNFLTFRVMTISRNTGSSCYLSLTLFTVVKLHPTETITMGSIWSDGILITRPPGTLYAGIEENCQKLVDNFMNQYLKENPK